MTSSSAIASASLNIRSRSTAREDNVGGGCRGEETEDKVDDSKEKEEEPMTEEQAKEEDMETEGEDTE